MASFHWIWIELTIYLFKNLKNILFIRITFSNFFSFWNNSWESKLEIRVIVIYAFEPKTLGFSSEFNMPIICFLNKYNTLLMFLGLFVMSLFHSKLLLRFFKLNITFLVVVSEVSSSMGCGLDISSKSFLKVPWFYLFENISSYSLLVFDCFCF